MNPSVVDHPLGLDPEAARSLPAFDIASASRNFFTICSGV